MSIEIRIKKMVKSKEIKLIAKLNNLKESANTFLHTDAAAPYYF